MSRLLASLVAMTVVSAARAGSVLRVDDDAPAAGDGTTWATAYRFLQDALAFASNPGNGVTTIRVAQGMYHPDRDEANAGGTGDRDASFELLDGVAIEGGYAGIGAPDPDARDIAANETTLSGDLLSDDGPDFANNDENSYHVVSAVLVDATAVIDGVTITAGNADGGQPGSPLRDGAGIWNVVASPIIVDCTIRENRATFGGGMAVVNGSDPSLVDCSFAGNQSLDDGGGVHVDVNSSATLHGCSFTQNASGDNGGGIFADGPVELVSCDFVDNAGTIGGGVILSGDPGTPALIVNCRFSGNIANSHSGGLHIGFNSVTLINSVFHGNQANRSGGLSCGGPTTIDNCTIVGNTAQVESGGLAIGSFVTVQNTIVWGNTPDQINADELFPPTTLFCDVEGGWPGGSNIDVDPMFVDEPNGNLELLPGSPCIDTGICVPLPDDIADLDDDGDMTEPLPEDIDGGDRIANTAIDIGAHEHQGPFGLPGDVNRDGVVGIEDFLLLLAGWGACCPGDLNIDGVIDSADLDLIIPLIGPCPPAGPCPGDLNGDGVVGIDDVQLLAGGLGICDTCPPDDGQAISSLIRSCVADANRDGVVGIVDFLTLLGNWD